MQVSLNHREAKRLLAEQSACSMVKGTSGSVRSARFREWVWMAALQDRSCFGMASPASSFRTELPHGCRAEPFSRLGGARACDKRCPSRTGWGKSVAASGRCDGGWSDSFGGPWPGKARQVVLVRGSATLTRGGSPSQEAEGDWAARRCARRSTQLQKPASGMWPEGSGE